MARQVLTVSQVNRYIKGIFNDDRILRNIYVKGEISGCKYHSTGHIYFTLKDSGGVISCVMFASDRAGLRFVLKEGMSVIILGYISVFERNGSYQLYAKEVFQDGRGALYEAYDALKKKLYEQGLFDQAHKKRLPRYPSTLGIVTAKTGAAIQDIINVSLRRNPWIRIVFCPAQVQGEGAAQSVAAGIRALERFGVDVIIVGRGGGSIEDLWAFNEEILARTVYDCGTPIISAVGHETDTTIIDYVSDLRAPTPSAAAELAVPDMRRVFSELMSARSTLDGLIADRIGRERDRIASAEKLLMQLEPGRKVIDYRRRLAELSERADRNMELRLEESRNRLSYLAGTLEAYSPLMQLQRGYAYVTDEEGHGISSISQVERGSILSARVTDGVIRALVQNTEEKAQTVMQPEEPAAK